MICSLDLKKPKNIIPYYRHENTSYGKLGWESEHMTQTEAQSLIQVLKKLLQHGSIILPQIGNQTTLELRSVFSDKDRFTVIFNRNQDSFYSK